MEIYVRNCFIQYEKQFSLWHTNVISKIASPSSPDNIDITQYHIIILKETTKPLKLIFLLSSIQTVFAVIITSFDHVNVKIKICRIRRWRNTDVKNVCIDNFIIFLSYPLIKITIYKTKEFTKYLLIYL